MTSVKAGWKTLTLHDWGMQAQSGFASGKHNSKGLGIIHLRPMNISSDGKVVLNEVKHVEDNSDRRVQQGDVLFNNTNSDVWVGKTAYISSEHSFAFSNHMTRLRFPDNLIDPKFMALKLHSLWMMGYFKEICSNHVNQASISTRRLSQVHVSIPSIAEQHRIVEILEDHLSQLDAALAEVKQARLKTAQFRRSLLQVSLNGKFSDNKINLITNLPEGWKWLTLNDVARWGSGGTPKSSDKSLYGGEIPWIVIGDLTEGLVNDTAQTINQKGLASSSAKLMPPGTVMIAMYGASIGRTGIMAKAMTTNQAIACGIVNESIMAKEYLLYYLQSQKQDFIYAGKGGAQPNISQGVVKDWKIPVPSIGEQEKIIQKIEEQLSHLEHSSKVASEIELSSRSFRRSLLQAAFTGQLTRDIANV